MESIAGIINRGPGVRAGWEQFRAMNPAMYIHERKELLERIRNLEARVKELEDDR